MASTRTQPARSGRPSEQDAPRKNTLGVRVTDEELQAFEQAAREDDRDVSAWLRHLGRKAVGLRG